MDYSTGMLGAQALEETSKSRLAIEEFLIDLFGGFLPGLLFLGATAFALVPPLYALILSLHTEDKTALLTVTTSFIRATRDTPSVFWILVLIGGGGLAYVAGHLFYRQDPDGADKASFRWLKRQLKRNIDRHNRETGENLSLRTEDIEKELACRNESECKFPYPRMHEYLKAHGLHHLCPLVRWHVNNGVGYPIWNKRYVDLLKTRLRYHHPDKCGALLRNEAHVRLAVSSWCIARVLGRVGAFGTVIAICSTLLITERNTIVFALFRDPIPWDYIAQHLPAILAPATVGLFAWFALWQIRRFLHNQRLREIVYVLETAFIAFYADKSKPLGRPFPSRVELERNLVKGQKPFDEVPIIWVEDVFIQR